MVARVLIRDLAGKPRGPVRPLLPYFWSDQYGRRVQLLGHPGLAERVELLHGEEPDDPRTPAPRKLLAGYYAGDCLVAVAGISATAFVMRYRRLLEHELRQKPRPYHRPA